MLKSRCDSGKRSFHREENVPIGRDVMVENVHSTESDSYIGICGKRSSHLDTKQTCTVNARNYVYVRLNLGFVSAKL